MQSNRETVFQNVFQFHSFCSLPWVIMGEKDIFFWLTSAAHLSTKPLRGHVTDAGRINVHFVLHFIYKILNDYVFDDDTTWSISIPFTEIRCEVDCEVLSFLTEFALNILIWNSFIITYYDIFQEVLLGMINSTLQLISRNGHCLSPE